MTDGPHAMREGHWSEWSSDDHDDDRPDDQGDDVETETVRERLADVLGDDDLHGLALTRTNGATVYGVVSRSTTWDEIDEDRPDIPMLDVRTVVVDLDADTVKLSDNGLWVPREADVAGSVSRLLARTDADLSGLTDDGDGPLLKSAVDDLDADDVLDREIEVEREVEGQYVDKMDSHTGIDPSRRWGYGAGPPPEVSTAVERLREAGLDPSDHVTRLVWGKKEPMDRKPRPVDELTGNYGIELLPRDSGLVAIDVDYPEHFPRSELPETFEVSSPHGDDSRRHIVFRCDEKERLADELGAWAVQGIQWGDLWIGDRYLVGPGSQLSEFGCDADGYERGERGGCEACEDPDGGYYRVVSDAPIATVSADRVLSLLEESDGYTLRNGPADNDPPESDDGDDQEERDDGRVPCDSCGAAREPDALKSFEVGGSTRHICRGGCDE